MSQASLSELSGPWPTSIATTNACDCYLLSEHPLPVLATVKATNPV